MLSTVSDIGFSMIKAYMGDKNTMQKFDLGGYFVTLSQICTSQSIIATIETEFAVNRIIKELNKY